MIRLQDSLSSPRAARDGFAFACDFRNLVHWDPTCESATKLTPGAIGTGTEFEVTMRFGPRRLAMRYVVGVFDPDRRAVLTGTGDGVTALDELRVEPLSTGSRLIWTTDITLTEAGRWTERALRPLLALGSRRANALLRRVLDAEPAPGGAAGWRNLMDRTLLPGATRFTAAGHRAGQLQPVVDRLDGRTVVLTGATSGLGLAAATALTRLGARLVVVGRDAAKLAAVRAALEADSGGTVIAEVADLESMAAVRALAARLLATQPRIDVLINNAGALFATRALTVDGRERSYAVNLLAPFVLTEALLPRLVDSGTATAPSRIVNVSSGGMYLQKLAIDDLDSARGRYDGSRAYARAKRGLVALTADWTGRLREAPVVVQAMHPGWADTPGIARSLPGFRRLMRPWLRSAGQGADTIVWLAASPRAVESRGRFWLDRQPHLTDVLPGTAVRHEDRERLRTALQADARASGA